MKKYLVTLLVIFRYVMAEEEIVQIPDLTYEDDEEMYLKVFGHVDQQEDMLFDTEVFVDGESVGSAPTIIGKNIKVQVFAFKSCLKEYLDQEDIKIINKFTDEDGFVDFCNLKEISACVKFNRLKMIIDVKVPISKKKVRNLSGRSNFVKKKPNVSPANVSAILNMRISQSFNKNQLSSFNNSHVVFSPVLNLFGLCLEGDVSYKKDSRYKGKFKRNYATLVYDWAEPDIMFRYGDVFSQSLNYQNPPHVWGVNVKKDVEREKVSGNTNPIQITIFRTSTIEIYSNNQLIRTKTNVAPGTYILDDISYRAGFNDIKVKIIDETGKENVLNEGFFLESAYVPKGKFVCSGTYGYPDVSDPKKGRYDKTNPIFCFSAKYGLLTSLEIGAGLLKNKLGKTLSYEIRNSNKIGHFTFRFANSRYKVNNISVSGKVFYAMYSSPSVELFGKTKLSCSVSFEKLDRFFKPYLYEHNAVGYGNDLIRKEKNLNGKNTSITYRLDLSNVFSFNTGISYFQRNNSFNQKSKRFTWNISRGFNINNDFLKRGNVSFSFGRYKDDTARKTKSFSIYCSLFLKDSLSVNSGYSKYNNEYNKYITANYFSTKSKWDGSVSFNQFRNNKGINLHANYFGRIFRIQMKHTQTSFGLRSSGVSAESAIYFADGRFAVSRSNYSDGGFVLVTPKKDLSKISFLNKNIESGFWGGGAVLNASRISQTESRIDLREIPDNICLKQDTIIAQGQYKRGFISDIEGSQNIIAKGVLVDSNGIILKKVTGFAVNKDNLDEIPVSFFTNEDGEFVLFDVKPGNYKITVNLINTETIDLKIKETRQTEEYKEADLGTVVCRDLCAKGEKNGEKNEKS